MLVRLLRRHLRPYTGLLVCVLVLQFAQVMASLYLPTLNADIIDKGVATGDSGYIWRMGAFMLGVSLAQGVCSVAATYLAARAAMSMGRDLRGEVFDRVSGFSEREISAFGAGSLITRNTNDVQQVQMLVMMSATMLVTAPVMAVGGIVMAVTRAPGLSWLIGVSVPVLLVAVGLIVSRMLPLFRSYQDKLDAINRVMREQLTGIRVIRAFVREEAETERFGDANTDIARVGERVGQLFVLLFPLVMLVLDVTIVGVIWFGGHQVGDGDVEVGTLIAFMSYLMQILMGIVMASFMTIMIPRAAVCAERISEVLATPPTITSSPDAVDTFPTPGTVEMRDVTFVYPNADARVLAEVSFTVQPGTTTAIVGSTAAGKSTGGRLRARNRLSLSPCQPTSCNNACLSKSRPAPVLADRLMTVSAPVCARPSERMATGSPVRSALLWISIFFKPSGRLFKMAWVLARFQLGWGRGGFSVFSNAEVRA